MPIYEYHCGPCDHVFEALVRHANGGAGAGADAGTAEAAPCPRCGGRDAARLLSVPSAAQVGRAGAGASDAPPMYGCGRPECGQGSCAGLG